ncbi:MAG: leucyl aminopeptidase [Desulfobulbaceae bacterium]|nr:leucyl aminopeptidase [Desulfobulbaceae bacterium]
MIKLTEKNPDQAGADLLVYFVPEDDGRKKPACRSAHVVKALQHPWKEGDFSGKEGQVYQFYPADCPKGKDGIRATRALVVGLGTLAEQGGKIREQLRIAGGTATAQARKCKAAKVVAVLPDTPGLAPEDAAECLAEGLILANYLFAKYKKKLARDEEPFLVKNFLISGSEMPAKALRKGMKKGADAALAACVARDMASEPGSSWTPLQFAEYARKLARRTDLQCTVLDKADMKKLGMGGILAVNQGSAIPPKLVILQYRTSKKNPTLMLVGKGLTFDSGGISLKPAAGMEDMKYDMCGGAAVLAAMEAVAREKPANLNIVALVPATDNMSGPAALKPGDIITHYNGATCEVVNTDAEGRLLLADALAYGIKKYNPDAVVDLATLTGAVIVGLGHHMTGLLSNNDNLVEQILAAGELCGEPLWRLPLGTEYTKQLKSEVADMKNIGGKGAGTITAAAFLQEFVGDTPWAHLDIAGTAWNFTEKSYVPPKGPSGIGVRTLLALIRNWQPI